MFQEPADHRSQQIDRIIAHYLVAAESGTTPDREQLFDRYPALAHELRAFFADHYRMRAARACIDEPTLQPRQADADIILPGAPLESTGSPRNRADAHVDEAPWAFPGQSR